MRLSSLVARDLLILSALLASSLSLAAPAPSFYRSPTSMVTSGQASRSKLISKLIKTYKENWLQVKYDGAEHRLSAENVIKGAHLSKSGETTLPVMLLEKPQTEAKALLQIPAQTLVETQFIDTYWAQVIYQGRKGFVPWHLLTARRDDDGFALTVGPIALRTKPNDQSLKLATIPGKHPLKILALSSAFAKVSYAGQIGYVSLSQILHRSDFGHFAHLPGKGWIQYSHREGDVLVGLAATQPAADHGSQNLKTTQARWPLSQFNGFFISPDSASIASDTFQIYPPVGAKVQVLQSHYVQWGVSQLEGHGDVYWKLDSIQSKKSNDVTTTEDLLSKPIYQFAFDPKKTTKAIVSASEGVFYTLDGLNWKELKDLRGQAVPVAIDIKGRFFAGSLMSNDHGETFEPYIKWDNVADVLGSEFPFHPKTIKLQSIATDPVGRITLQLASPSKKIKLQSSSFLHEWRLIK